MPKVVPAGLVFMVCLVGLLSGQAATADQMALSDNSPHLIAQASSTVDDASILFERARVKMEKHDLAGAIADFSKAIETRKDNPAYYYDRGLAYTELKNYQAAIADYQAAIKLNPKYAKAYWMLGVAEAQLKDFDAGVRDLTKARELDSGKTGASALCDRGLIRQKQNNHKEAIDDFSAAIAIRPDLARAYSSRGYSYRNLNDYEKARADYDKAIELDPKLSIAFIHRGYLESLQKDWNSAMKDFSTAIALDPKSRDAYLDRGKAKAALGDNDGAIADYNQALKLGGNPSAGGNSSTAGLAPQQQKVSSLTPEQTKQVNDYMAAIQPYIKSYWLPPKNTVTKKTGVYFKESPAGDLTEIAVRESSGNDEFDAAAKTAVEKANPLPPPPSCLKPPVEILFHFDYNVFNKSGVPR
jgi:TonB family protein